MRRIAVTGGAGPVGRRFIPLIESEVERIVVIDSDDPGPISSKAEFISADVLDAGGEEAKRLLDGCDALVHLSPLAPGSSALTRLLLDAAGSAGVEHVILLSSAAVYGAWPDNPVPLTEEAPLRPNPGFGHAVEAAEAERLVSAWKDDHSGAAVAVLRPAIVLAPEGEDWVARALGRPPWARPPGSLPPSQFLHPGDLASAVAHALNARLDGVYNVAPDGWIPGDTVAALGASVGLPLGERLAALVARASWRLGIGRTPPPARPYTLHPWVVASDRLRSTGWNPRWSNEEAVVAARPGSWWRELGPRRRQEVTLALAGAGLVAAVGGVIAVAVRAGRRR